jgi:imidazolonepropionase-like amidohydrolase
MKKAVLLAILTVLPTTGVFAQQRDDNQQDSLVFTHVTVIDMTGAPAQPNMTVVVRGDRIEALGKTGKLPIPPNARLVDATGKFLIPGLWDMHVHPREEKNYLALFPAYGVTGVRVMRGYSEHYTWREEISAGKLIGPRMVIASPLIGESTIGVVVRNEEEGRQFVREFKKAGADFIKVYAPDFYFAIADEAKKLGIPFAGHLPFKDVTAAEASAAGQLSIEHIYFVSFACSTEEELELHKKIRESKATYGDTLPFVRDRYKLMADVTYSEKKAAELFSRFVENSTWVCPTLRVWQDLLFNSEGDIANNPRLKYAPPSIMDDWKWYYTIDWATGKGRADLKKLSEKQLALVGAMNRAGVGLLAGTDGVLVPYSFPGFGLHEELMVFVQAGLSPMQALQTATYNAAKCLGMLDSMGTIEQGKIADLVLLDANPLQDIRNTRKIATVVVGGRVFDKTALQKMLIQVEAQVKAENLYQAANKGEIEQVELLISEGAEVNFKNNEGLTALHAAARGGHKKIVELLLAHGAEVNISEAKYNSIAAEFAMNRNHTEIFQLLVSNGADISPLHFAIYMNDEAKARSLIETGADVHNRTPQGTTPLNLAIHMGLKDIAKLLIAHDADVNANHFWGWTPLHGAAEKWRRPDSTVVREGSRPHRNRRNAPQARGQGIELERINYEIDWAQNLPQQFRCNGRRFFACFW